MSNEIATYSMIYNKLNLGTTGNECPTKTLILAISSLIFITNESTYGANECVRIDDINKSDPYANYLFYSGARDFTVPAVKQLGIQYPSSPVYSYESNPYANFVYPKGYTVTSHPDWVTSDSCAAENMHQDEYNAWGTSTVLYENNPSTSPRTGEIIFTQEESGKTLTWTITLEGKSEEATVEYEFSIYDWELNMPASGGVTSAMGVRSYKTENGVSTDLGYSLYSGLPSWATYNYDGTFNVNPNTTSSDRSADIYFEQNESGKTDYCRIYQSGLSTPDPDPDPEPDPDPPTPTDTYVFTWSDGSTSSKSMDLPYQGSSSASSFSIVSTKNGNSQSWSVSSEPNWVNTSISGSSLSVTIDANDSSARSGTIVLTQSGSDNTLEINVSQQAKPDTPTPPTPSDTYTFEIRKSTEEYSGKTSITFDNVPANTDGWSGGYATKGRKNGEVFTERSFSSDSSWISVDSSGNYTVAHNTSSSSRSGTITITQGESGLKCYIYINQDGVITKFTFADGHTTIPYYVPALTDSIWADDAVHTETDYNKTPFISIYQGRNVDWVTKTTSPEVSVTIDGNKMTIVTKKNKTGIDRELVTSWAQWDSETGGYTGVPDIQIVVHQNGHDL